MSTSGIVLDCRNLGDLYDDSRYHHTLVNTNGVIVRGLHGRGVYFNGVDVGMINANSFEDAEKEAQAKADKVNTEQLSFLPKITSVMVAVTEDF